MRSISDLLNEGMWAGDLKNLMRPVISIDEYQSKIDDRAIVIGFYVHDKDAAQDLNRFIQKSPYEVLDVDISKVADQQGYYIVFVELLKNDQLPQLICDIANEVSMLSDTEAWNASVFGIDKEFKLNVDLLKDALATADAKDKKRARDDLKTKIKDAHAKARTLKKRVRDALAMLHHSDLPHMKEGREGHMVLHDGISIREFEVVSIGENALSEASLTESPLLLAPEFIRECRGLAISLGEGWDVHYVSECYVLENCRNDFILVLREID